MVTHKNHLSTDAIREIRGTMNRFLSILVLSALAVAFLAGLRATAPDMKYTADRYYDRTGFMDGWVLSTLGLTDGDLEALAGAQGVQTVEGCRDLDAVAVDRIVSVRSLPQRLNLLEVKEGRLPQSADECVTERLLLVKLGLQVGDKLELTLEEDSQGDLANTVYTITGVVDSPLYVSLDRGASSLGSGSVDAFLFVPGENFTYDYYTAAYFTGEGLRELDSYGDEYEDRAEALLDSLDPLGSERAEIRYETLVGDAQTELDEAQAELDDARAEADQELADGRRELDDARRELDEGWDEYEKGRAEAEAELTDALKELTDGEAAYSDGLQELSEGRAELAEGQQKLEDAQRELADAQRKLDDAKADLDRAPGELADARRELDEGWTEYNDGKSKADREFADAEAELTDAEREVADAYAELADLKQATTYVLTRQENTGYVNFDNDTSIVAAISVVFPAFFFLVAALVCMTTMTRMVDEQRTQIGVLKAMGYSNWQIMGKYLFYAGSAALLGSVLGYALGAVGLPWIIWEIYGMIYGFAPLKQVFLPELALLSFSAALLCAMGSTYLACRVELGRQAAELIRPKSPRAGKRVFLEYIGPVWRRLSFLHKVSVRNVLRYRSRLVMMVLGIGGCTALLCTGFGIRDSIAHVADDQFDEITLYDYAVTFQEGQTLSSAEAYLEASGWLPEEGLLVHSGSVDVQAPGGGKSVHLVVSSTDSLDGFLSLHSGETAIPYPGDGEVVVNTGLAEKLGLSVGDTVRLQEKSLGEMEATVSAIADNYVFNYAYVSAGTFQRQLGRTPEYNTLYVRAHPGADPYEEGALLLEDEGVGSVTVNEATRSQVDSMLSRLDYIVAVVVLCAAALAFIVLYNLTNINITERVREIATIKVLGFYQGEVAAYVFREIIILSALGSLAGLGMGKALHAFVMEQIQIDAMFFACRITPLSYLVAFVVTMLFTAVISLGMRPRLRKIDMAESLKSIE